MSVCCFWPYRWDLFVLVYRILSMGNKSLWTCWKFVYWEFIIIIFSMRAFLCRCRAASFCLLFNKLIHRWLIIIIMGGGGLAGREAEVRCCVRCVSYVIAMGWSRAHFFFQGLTKFHATLPHNSNSREFINLPDEKLREKIQSVFVISISRGLLWMQLISK